MIGIFDSGLGGVLTAKYIHDELPAYDLFILADEAYVPYGEKDPERIRHRTFKCLHRMFDQGCSIVILACNTASMAAIADRQKKYPEKKVLSISVPGVEEVITYNLHHIGVLATRTSVETNFYPHMFSKYYPTYPIEIEQVIGEGLVHAIEKNDEQQIKHLVKIYTTQFSATCEAIILGCTHYPFIQEQLQKKLPNECLILNPGAYAAKQLIPYLQRHTDLAKTCTTCTGGGSITILTTQVSPQFSQQCQHIRGNDCHIETKTI